MQSGGLNLFQAIADKMRWHQARQGVLAENVANADTPNYVERDLAPFTVEDGPGSAATLALRATSPGHLAATSAAGGFAITSRAFEVSPSGNGVTLEDEMMKVAANDMDYQTVTALYTRSVRIIKVALGRTA